MKRILLFCAACTVLLWSCAKDNIPSAEKSTVTFSLASSDEATRAYGKGLEVNDLRYAIYAYNDYSRPLVVRVCDNEFASSLSTTITEDLIAGHHYTIIFWADHDGADGANTYIYNTRAYEIDWRNPSVTLNTSGLTANDDTLDAFFACVDFTAQVGGRVDVDLKRPFAQLNIATSDVDINVAANRGATVTHTALKIVACTTLNLLTGEVSNPQTLTFDKAAIPSAETISVNGETYNLLSVNYILVGAQEQSASATLTAYGTKDGSDQQLFEATFDELSLKRNCRTNVVGNIILSYIQ